MGPVHAAAVQHWLTQCANDACTWTTIPDSWTVVYFLTVVLFCGCCCSLAPCLQATAISTIMVRRKTVLKPDKGGGQRPRRALKARGEVRRMHNH